MADHPQEPTSDEQLRNLQDQVRRLWTRIPKNVAWPWYSLRPYLCGGWYDLFSSHPYRNADGVLDPADVTDKAGFFDTGEALIFSGNIYWDPDSWYAVSPYDPADVADPLQQGNPPKYKDSKYILGRFDGLAKPVGTVAENNDLGAPLPYRIPEQGSGVYTLPLSSSKHYSTAVGWLNGAVLSFSPLQETGGFMAGFNWNTFHSLVGNGTNGDVTDPAGFVHQKMPADRAVVSLNGLIIRYVEAFSVPTGVPGYPRDYDNFFGVDMSRNDGGVSVTPDDAELRRRVDGLFVSYGEVMGAWGKVDTRVDGLSKQIENGLADLKDDLKEIDEECKTWHNEYRQDKKVEMEGRVSNKTIIIAMIGGSATVLAAIIAAAAVILTGGN